MSSTTIRVDYLARVEGEGGIQIRVAGDRVTDIKVPIFEPPRFFEALLRGRAAAEAPDITARICGICPVAHQLTSVQALEKALGVPVSDAHRALRRLLYCGEWIESHALHVYLLHAPDFLGYPDAMQMARLHGDAVRRGLRLKKVGNAVVAAVGGREIHPINVCIGGLFRAPDRAALDALIGELEWAVEAAEETVRFAASLPMPDLERDYQFVALHDPAEYAIDRGRLASSWGLDIDADAFETQFTEEHVAHSNALRASHNRYGSYLVGPLARYNLNADQLSPRARAAAEAAGLERSCRNPFRSIVVRSVEMLYACEEALRLLRGYEEPTCVRSSYAPRAGVGAALTEAPRGTLYHRYGLGQRGEILNARLVIPTAQNLRTMEEDLWAFVPARLSLPRAELTRQCEQAVRNYDPCISCATHAVRITDR